MLSSLKEYYNKKNVKILLDTLIGTDKISRISIRLIEWFVSTYSQINNIEYLVNGKMFNIYNEYNLMKNGYGKNIFDPNGRGNKICFECDENKQIETTIGQLHYFKWAINNNIIHYIRNNYEEINKAMSLYDKNKRKLNPSKKSSSTNSLSQSLSVEIETNSSESNNNESKKRIRRTKTPSTTTINSNYGIFISMSNDEICANNY